MATMALQKRSCLTLIHPGICDSNKTLRTSAYGAGSGKIIWCCSISQQDGGADDIS